MQLTLTTQESFEEYLNRIFLRLIAHKAQLKKQKEKYAYDTFLRNTVTSPIEDDILVLKRIKYVIHLAMKEPKKKMHVSLDAEEIDAIHKELDYDQ